MKASEKSEAIDHLLTSIFGVDRKSEIENNTCVCCGNIATDFDTDRSRKEYTISGLCQDCQNSVFY